MYWESLWAKYWRNLLLWRIVFRAPIASLHLYKGIKGPPKRWSCIACILFARCELEPAWRCTTIARVCSRAGGSLFRNRGGADASCHPSNANCTNRRGGRASREERNVEEMLMLSQLGTQKNHRCMKCVADACRMPTATSPKSARIALQLKDMSLSLVSAFRTPHSALHSFPIAMSWHGRSKSNSKKQSSCNAQKCQSRCIFLLATCSLCGMSRFCH